MNQHRTMTDLVRDSSRADLDPEWIRGALALIPPERFEGLGVVDRVLYTESMALFMSQRYPDDSAASRRYWWTTTVMHLGRAFAHHQGRCVAHVFRPAACALVASTDLRDMPSEPPRILRGPWLIAGSAGPLFGDTLELGGYPDGPHGIRLVGRFDDSGVVATSWRPEWGERFSFKLPREADKEASKNPEEAAAWGAEAARFAVMAGLLLDAEGTPFQPRDEADNGPRDARTKRPRREADWITRHIYLDHAKARAREAPADHVAEAGKMVGLVPERVEVRGHLRNQPCGPQRSERKWVYVAPFAATRWVREGDVRVVTHARGVA